MEILYRDFNGKLVLNIGVFNISNNLYGDIDDELQLIIDDFDKGVDNFVMDLDEQGLDVNF